MKYETPSAWLLIRPLLKPVLKTFTITLYAAIAVLAIMLAVAVRQNYFSNPAYGCTRYNASTGYWGYACSNHNNFYEAK